MTRCRSWSIRPFNLGKAASAAVNSQVKAELAEAERQRKEAAAAAKKAQKEAQKQQEQQNALNAALNWWDTLQQPGGDPGSGQLPGGSGTGQPGQEKSNGFWDTVKDAVKGTVKSMFSLGTEDASDKIQSVMPGGNIPSVLGPQKAPAPDKKSGSALQKQREKTKGRSASSKPWATGRSAPRRRAFKTPLPGGNIASVLGVRPEAPSPELPKRTLSEQLDLYAQQAAKNSRAAKRAHSACPGPRIPERGSIRAIGRASAYPLP